MSCMLMRVIYHHSLRVCSAFLALWFVPTGWTQNTFELELSMLELIVKLFFCYGKFNAKIRLDRDARCFGTIAYFAWTNIKSFAVVES